MSYGYGPVTNAINNNEFPTILEIASILPNDGAAASKWASIQPNVPNIAPKVSTVTLVSLTLTSVWRLRTD